MHVLQSKQLSTRRRVLCFDFHAVPRAEGIQKTLIAYETLSCSQGNLALLDSINNDYRRNTALGDFPYSIISQ